MMKSLGIMRLTLTVVSIIYILIPLIVVIPASFTSANYPSFPAEGFSLQWYTKLLDSPEFLEALVNSTKFALMAAFFSILFGTLGALAIAKYDIPGKTYITSLLTSPLSVTAACTWDCVIDLLYSDDVGGYKFWIFDCSYNHMYSLCDSACTNRFKRF